MRRLIDSTWVLLTLVAMAAGCKSPSTPASGAPPLANDVPSSSARSQGGKSAEVGFRIDCFGAYTGCEPLVGLPAISGDGKRVAVPDLGPDTGRDEFILTMRVLDVDTGGVVKETPIVTYDDYEGLDIDTQEMSPERRRVIGERIHAFERVLAEGEYRPLISVGSARTERPVARNNLRAEFDGKELAITDTRTSEVLWRTAIGPSTPFTRGDGEVCGPFPVADIDVWVSLELRVAVARVGYVGSDLCATEYPYLVWR